MLANAVYSQFNSVKAVFTVGRVRVASLVLLLQINLLSLLHVLTSNSSNEELLVASNEVKLVYLLKSIVFEDSFFRMTVSKFSVSSGRTIVAAPDGA